MAVSRRLTIQTLSALVALSALAACSTKSNSSGGSSATNPASAGSGVAAVGSTDTGSGQLSARAAAGNAPAGKTSDMSMRVVNLYAPKSDSGTVAAGPALDVYDVPLTGQPATPVAKNVAYGTASPYFTPQVPAGSFGNPAVELYALPAGEDPVAKHADAQGIGGALDDNSHAQITFVLTADNSGVALSGPLSRLSFSDRVEKGDDGNGSKAPVAPAPASGQGEILVDTSAAIGFNTVLYLLIDSSCAPPINGDPNAKTLPEIFNAAIDGIDSAFAIFSTTPGSHQVSLVPQSGDVTPTCDQLTAKQGTTTVNVAAGQQIEAYVYGTSATDVHLALAPIQQ